MVDGIRDMRVAICDDDEKQLNMFSDLLTKYRTPSGESVCYDSYLNIMDLLDVIDKRKYDGIFLDILMPGITGMDAARDIRDIDGEVPIVFLTNSPEYAVESYRVQAFDYILKPAEEQLIKRIIDRIYDRKNNIKKNTLTIYTAKAVHTFPFSKIEYLEVNNRTLFFHFVDGTSKGIGGKLGDYENVLLERPEFLKIHRSYIINMDLMKSLEKKDFISFSGKRIPISRNLWKDIQEKYINYLHSIIT